MDSIAYINVDGLTFIDFDASLNVMKEIGASEWSTNEERIYDLSIVIFLNMLPFDCPNKPTF